MSCRFRRSGRRFRPKCWGILLLFGAIYIIIGTLILELIDKDKR